MIKLHITDRQITIGELTDRTLIIASAQDAVELISNSGSPDCDRFVIYENNLHEDFFDLKSRLAGDILQKFSNYRVRLAVVGDFSKFRSKSLRDFFRESNKLGHILFVATLGEALAGLNR
jgi:hypothetical protein